DQILSNVSLDPKLKQDRIKRAKHDFKYFAKTYFPHYFTIKGECELHNDLALTFESIASSPKGEKYAKAAPRGHAKTTYCS
ncbi:hypothetical protein ACPF04_12365, partial [Campylobacter sp. MOP51]